MRPELTGQGSVQVRPPETRIRLDLFLRHSRLVPRRSLAHEICAQGGIWMNGQVAKAAQFVKPGDIFKMQLRGRMTQIRVLRIPETPCTKQEAAALYEQVESPYVQRFSE